MSQVVDTRQVKAAYCPTCGGWVMLSEMPWAETNADTRKEFGKCAKAGYIIKILAPDEAHAPGYCTGHKAHQPAPAAAPDLFSQPA